MPSITVLAPTTRDCRARVTAACEQTTTDPDAVCPACADEIADLAALLAGEDGVAF